ncbi:MAG: TonB-dependent receptor [Bacteroidota bacterium]
MKQLVFFPVFIVCLLTYFFADCYGQSVTIKVLDNSKNPLPAATVQFIKTSDSTSVYTSTNQNGLAVFEELQNTLYVVKISYIGYETLVKSIMIKPTERNFYFRLKQSTISLDAVTVTAKTPLIRQEDDKMIIDPENLANTSTNTLEVLENTPGMYVDQDGGIYLTSATPAKVYINGREQKMSDQDIATILRSLPSGSVQKIEVMRTPSTKYDASSSGGIINIVLKKGVKIGRFGSINLGMNQGKFGNRFAGFTINDSGDKSTKYINVNYNYNDMEELLNVNRLLKTDTFLQQTAISRNLNHQLYTGYGISYDPSEKLNFSYDGRFNYSLPESATINQNIIETIKETSLSENENIISNNSYFLNLQQDFGINLKLDTIGSEWDSKLSYSFNNKNTEQDYKYDYTLPLVYSLSGNGLKKQQGHNVNLQTDIIYKLAEKLKLETGVKSSLQYYENDDDYFINTGDSVNNDPLRTNAFCYTENLNAAYLQTSGTLKNGFIIKAGVRLEHTFMEGRQSEPSDTSFIVNRVDWFPYFYLSRRILKIMGIELDAYMIYRRTINRPDYQMLNPSINFVDQYMYETGNPGLNPQFTDNVEVNISFDDTPVFAIGQNYTTDIFSGVVYSNPSYENVAVRTFDNLGKNRETYFRAMAGIPPGGRYFFVLGSQFNLNEYDGFYENQPLKYSRGSWRFFTFHVLKLFKSTKIIISGFMMINGQRNFYELKNFGSLNFGLRQTFFNDKLNISLNARDVFRTMVICYEINQGSIFAWGDKYTDNQRFGINIGYTFGIREKEEKSKIFNFETE